MLRFLVLLGFFLLGCSTPNPAVADAGPADAPGDTRTDCAAGFLGDRTKDPQLEVRAIDDDGNDRPLAEMGDVALTLPPQGGRVTFVGVRATNVDGCGVQLTGAIRDLRSRQVRLDARTVNLNATADGWGTSSTGAPGLAVALANYSNIPMCPNQWSETNVFDTTYELEVTLKERSGRMTTRTMKVIPRCSEPGVREECLCICKVGYVLGQKCAADAGTDG